MSNVSSRTMFVFLALLVFILMIGVFYVTFSPRFTIKDDISAGEFVERTGAGQITGTVVYHKGMKAEGLQDRDVIVWLPPNYETDSDQRYPVLYMHDGQNLFDPTTSFIGTDWQVDETADSMIRSGELPGFIVVGIYNTSDRMYEYTPGQKGDAYLNFITHVLKPFIDDEYRTLPDRDNTFVGGSSAGGIVSFMIVWEHPDVFSRAICMSPAFRSPDGFNYQFNYIDTVKKSAVTPENVLFYIDNGGIDLEAQLQPGIDEMITALKSRGMREGVDFVFIKDEKAPHNEHAWADRMPEALRLIFSDK